MSVSVRGSEADHLPGKYRVLLELGQGGTAVVYLAVAQGPSGFNKLVVLKALKANLSSDPEFRRMFLNEARLSARLNHPNIVQVNEVFEQDGLPVIGMEYLDGRPLSEVLARAARSMTLPMHLCIISEVLSGLHYSHELTDYDGTALDVVHRDVTPHNVFVTFDGQVKILDFGIAKLSGSTVETQTGIIKGKIRYMPPEQIAGELVDRRSDVFSVGVMLWEAAAGTRIWRGLSEATIMNRVLKGELPAPSSVCPDVHPELERIIMKALAYHQEDRHSSALELQDDLDAHLAALGMKVTSREIGRFLTQHFQEYRAEIKRTIDDQLRATSFGSDPALPLNCSGRPASASLRTVTYSNGESAEHSSPSVLSAVKGWLRVGLLGGAALLSIASVTWAMGQRHVGPIGDVPRVTARLADFVALPRSAPARLRVTASPDAARIWLDGAELAGNPGRIELQRAPRDHLLRVEADGHEPHTQTLRVEHDQDVVIHLRPRAAAPSSGENSLRPLESAGSDPSDAAEAEAEVDWLAPTGPACSPAFTVDERGVKKYKAGCL